MSSQLLDSNTTLVSNTTNVTLSFEGLEEAIQAFLFASLISSLITICCCFACCAGLIGIACYFVSPRERQRNGNYRDDEVEPADFDTDKNGENAMAMYVPYDYPTSLYSPMHPRVHWRA